MRRRFELVGTAGSVRVFDDYAHHPTEISATLAAVRTLLEQSGGGRAVVVFQPICIRGQRLSPPSSVMLLMLPTRSSCSTSTGRGSNRWQA
ncbi:mur ligase family, glutamate ligase domain protein [Mycobacterium xenopi 4042]|uniref:Mur ligase family, glutamate ligase domain protein n=1 Tax=Mycobacterium xenopi 4042 TaxID=1299334 RepID=X7ZXJ7_MYCXE|nr:mur ligase family, glutamate ligase domain protein [Mycobacterium xenopi 4042]